MARRFLGGLLPDHTSPVLAAERKDDPVVIRASGGSSYVPWGQPVVSNWSVDQAVSQGYEKVPWLWRSIHAIANRSARLRMRCVKGEVTDPDDITFVEDPILDLFNVRAQPEIGSLGTAFNFRYKMATQLHLSKAGVYVEVVRKRGGTIHSLSLLPPQWTNPVPDPDMLVGKYQIWTPGNDRYELPAFNPDERDANSVIWVCYPHPTNPFSGTVAVEAAGLSVQTDYWVRLYNRNFMARDGRPGGILAVKGDFEPGAVGEMKQHFEGGPTQAGRTSVIEVDDVSYIDTSVTPRDAQYDRASEKSKKEILEGATGAPETILGWAADRTFDNADAEREVFWTETMPDTLNLIERAFDPCTRGGWEDEIRLWHDTSGIEVLRRAYEKRVDRALAQYQSGLITADEFRKTTGREPFDVAGTRVIWATGGKAPIGENDKDTQEAAKLQVLAVSSTQAGSFEKQAAQAQGAPASTPPSSPGNGMRGSAQPGAAAPSGPVVPGGGRRVGGLQLLPKPSAKVVALGDADGNVYPVAETTASASEVKDALGALSGDVVGADVLSALDVEHVECKALAIGTIAGADRLLVIDGDDVDQMLLDDADLDAVADDWV